MGETGVALESMIVRDGRSLDEAVVALKRLEPGLTRADVKKMADRLPRRRRRPRAVDLDSAFAELHAVAATPPEAVSEADRAALSCHIGRIVRSTIDLGHNLGLSVTAEGIETAETLEMLQTLGCDRAQGYLLSKPLSASDLEQWLGEQLQLRPSAS